MWNYKKSIFSLFVVASALCTLSSPNSAFAAPVAAPAACSTWSDSIYAGTNPRNIPLTIEAAKRFLADPDAIVEVVNELFRQCTEQTAAGFQAQVDALNKAFTDAGLNCRAQLDSQLNEAGKTTIIVLAGNPGRIILGYNSESEGARLAGISEEFNNAIPSLDPKERVNVSISKDCKSTAYFSLCCEPAELP